MTGGKRFRRSGIIQSKFGCYTCKTRKVKCDEHNRPGSCNNCLRGNRPCSWPPQPRLSPITTTDRRRPQPERLHVDTHESLTIPMTPMTTTTSPSHTVVSLSSSPSLPSSVSETGVIAQACQIVLRSYVDDFRFLQTVLRKSFFEYDCLCVSTTHAANVLVAAADQLTTMGSFQSPAFTPAMDEEYKRAVHHLNNEPSFSFDCARTSVQMTVIFLLSTDLILRRPLEAAEKLSRLQTLHRACSPPLSPDPTQACLDVEVLLRSFDIHRMTSSDCVVLSEMRPKQLHHTVPELPDLKSLGEHTINLVHATYAYIAATSLKVVGCQWDGVADLDQHRLVLNNITQTCTVIGQLLLQPASDQELTHLKRLQCLCKSIYIEMVNLFSESEQSFDDYAQQFETIITNAKQILDARQRDMRNGLPAFSLQIGLAQPLFLAATKYRHGSWRRRAIALLERVGQEGPWSGTLLAAVASRWVVNEELNALPTAVQSPYSLAPQDTQPTYYLNHSAVMDDPSSIPVKGRITACRFLEYGSINGLSAAAGFPFTMSMGVTNSTKVLFLSRIDNGTSLPARVSSCIDVEGNFYPGAISQLLDVNWFPCSQDISF